MPVVKYWDIAQGQWKYAAVAQPYGVSKEYVDSRTPQITVGTTPPTDPAVDDVWIDTN